GCESVVYREHGFAAADPSCAARAIIGHRHGEPELRGVQMSECIESHAAPIEARYPWTPFADEELDQSIPERFQAQERAAPARVAIRTSARCFTYDGLNRAANQLARTIVSMRGDREEAVALLFDHDADALAAMLAVLKAGKFYVVLDPTFPRDRLAYMLADSEAGLVVADANNLRLAAQLGSDALPVVNMDEIDDAVSQDNLGIPSSPPAPALF